VRHKLAKISDPNAAIAIGLAKVRKRDAGEAELYLTPAKQFGTRALLRASRNAFHPSGAANHVVHHAGAEAPTRWRLDGRAARRRPAEDEASI